MEINSLAGPISCHQWRAWERRADTLRRNAAALADDITRRAGPECEPSDFADNVLDQTEILCRVLGQRALKAKSPGRRKPTAPAVAADIDPLIVNKCRACRDGECFWDECPQIRDKEPETSGRHCPLDIGCPRCGRADDGCIC